MRRPSGWLDWRRRDRIGHSRPRQPSRRHSAQEPYPSQPPPTAERSLGFLGRDLSNRVVVLIADVDVPGRIEDHAGWIVELRDSGISVDEPIAAGAMPDDGRDASLRIDLPDGVVSLIGEVDVTGRVEHQVERLEELRGRGGAVDEAMLGGPPASEGRDVALQGDLAGGIVCLVREIDVSGCIDRDAERGLELRGSRVTVGKAEVVRPP